MCPLPLYSSGTMETFKACNLYIFCLLGPCGMGWRGPRSESTYIVVHSTLTQSPLPSSDLHWHQAYTWCMYTYASKKLKHTRKWTDVIKKELITYKKESVKYQIKS